MTTAAAQMLYRGYVAKQPIIDYHCHIKPREIYEDRRFENLSQLWLGGDHYKWRLLRANGVEEKYITGDGDGWEKFRRFAAVLPKAIGNPTVHWQQPLPRHHPPHRVRGEQGIVHIHNR